MKALEIGCSKATNMVLGQGFLKLREENRRGAINEFYKKMTKIGCKR